VKPKVESKSLVCIMIKRLLIWSVLPRSISPFALIVSRQTFSSSLIMSANGKDYDPYAPGMTDQYGLPGLTDPDGFDPYADTVGPGIYGGSVKRDEQGNVVIGEQYQNHNQRLGPVYDGTGYSLMSRAIRMGSDKVKEIISDYPELKDEVSTGGARPLHVCGMSKKGQHSTKTLIDEGADIYVQDTYGYTALHRMASNDLAVGGEALVRAGHDPNKPIPGADSTPIEIAKRSRAIQFLMKMQALGHYD
jgi:ankyrin repeat protein